MDTASVTQLGGCALLGSHIMIFGHNCGHTDWHLDNPGVTHWGGDTSGLTHSSVHTHGVTE